MEQEFEFGQFSETDDESEHIAEVQDRVIIKILNEVENGIENENETVILTVFVEPNDIIITKEAILEAKEVYSELGLPLYLDYFSRQAENGNIKQGFRIKINLQPDETEISE